MSARKGLCALLGLLLVAAAGWACSKPPPPAHRVAAPTVGTPAASEVAPASDHPARTYRSVLIENVPHVRQKPDFCGEAATEMYLRALGKPVDQDQVFALSGMPPERGMGATTRELKVALERLGFQVGNVWYSAKASRAKQDLDALFGELHEDLRQGVPSIVCTHYDERPNTTEHFRLVLGYDAGRDEVIYHDPAEADAAYRRMARPRFLSLWPLKYHPARWTVIRLRLDPDSIRLPSKPRGFSPADYAQHVRQLKAKLPPGFTVVIEPPFVVVGDSGPDRVRAHAVRTVRWAVERLKRDFFDGDPERILDIWLFEDADSYRRNVRRLFGEAPSTPFGFYSRQRGALAMNISTGGGTLVHEIVHPFMEANFPRCPAWFNEGLGSLFEQSADRDGHIVGLTNWRLAGLKRAIRGGRLPSFRRLTATTDYQFYQQDSGSNYAQARYLLYYLQERGLLVRFMREFLKNHRADPTGYATLRRVLGQPDMRAFQKRWEAYTSRLHFP